MAAQGKQNRIALSKATASEIKWSKRIKAIWHSVLGLISILGPTNNQLLVDALHELAWAVMKSAMCADPMDTILRRIYDEMESLANGDFNALSE